MIPDLEELKYQVHAARVALDYQKKATRSERYGPRDEQIAKAELRLEEAIFAYNSAKPAPVSLSTRSPYFIGPIRVKGVRGNGPTIKCFRCETEKPKEDFYKKGTVCKCCVIKRSSEWVENNPEKTTENKRNWSKKKRASDPFYRIILNCRNRLCKIMRGIGKKRGTHFSELISTTSSGLRAHLESQFLPGMTWDNYGDEEGKWVVDHIIPARFFNHLVNDEMKKCWHYTNLRPMWHVENQSKSDFLPCGARARHKKRKSRLSLTE